MRIGPWRFAVLAGAVVLAISACSSSSKSTSTPTTAAPTTGSAGSAGSATSSTSASSEVHGTPYKLVWLQTLQSESSKYMAAIEDGVNARGGIAGHPLQIVDCIDNGDANQATRCGQEAVADPRVLAIIGNGSTCSSQLLPILTRAQMASIADTYFCPEDFKSPQVFPFTGGTLTAADDSAIGIKYFKDPNVIFVTVDAPGALEYAGLVQTAIKPFGGKVVAKVLIPLGNGDLAPYAAQIASNKGVLTEGDDLATGIRLNQALQSIAYDRPTIYNPTVWSLARIKSNIGNPNNAYLAEYFDVNSPGWKMFESDMATYEHGSTYEAGDLLNAWAGRQRRGRDSQVAS